MFYTYAMSNEDREDPIYGHLQEDVTALQDQVIALQRAIVELKASYFSRAVSADYEAFYLNHLLHLNPQDKPVRDDRSSISTALNISLSLLRGKLSEEALPEDAYKAWVDDVRQRLTGIFNPSTMNSYFSQFPLWEKIMGFPEVH